MKNKGEAGRGGKFFLKTEVKKAYEEIMYCIIGNDAGAGACGVNITNQFQPDDDNHLSVPRNINAAFLISLTGAEHPRYNEAVRYLEEMEIDPCWGTMTSFYREGIDRLEKEFHEFLESRGREQVEKLRKCIHEEDGSFFQEELWSVFNPEAAGIMNNKDSKTEALRDRRKITLTRLYPNPVRNVAREVLFTSNALITLPSSHQGIDDLDVGPELKIALGEVLKEEQLFWYDHPIQIGVEPGRNEILYGLKHLSEAIQYEKKMGTIGDDDEVTCVLSASVTHEGLQGIAKDYIEGELNKAHDLAGLKVYLFTEADTGKMIHEILVPAAKRYLPNVDNCTVLLKEIIGVDGMYGRHYSFLKAVSAFWQVFIDSGCRNTFKFDLDQIFPQENLCEETGKTAFQHLMSPLWGADGVDSEGNPVCLGLIAGALVNEKDISLSLFNPDVTYPSPPFIGDSAVFCSKLPQALSTVAEMMTQYHDGNINGRDSCIQRIHVTGGTNGIVIDLLRKYRPFTPTFVGRAEDQAYLLSVLFPSDGEPALRYVHKDGFFMRHDKEAFAGEAIKAAAVGKFVGDIERILLFSNYAKVLPWGVERIKNLIDPFTGSFVSHLPLNIAYLRVALKGGALFATGNEEDSYKGLELLKVGIKRLRVAIEEVSHKGGLKTIFEREKKGWNLFYDILDSVENALKKGDAFAVELQEKARMLVGDTGLFREVR
jgi:hypothetical protein